MLHQFHTDPSMATRSPVPLIFGDKYLFDREISWLESHSSLLDAAEDPALSLSRRIRFLAFTTEKLDEFFRVRFAARSKLRSNHTRQEIMDQTEERTKHLQSIVNRVRHLVTRQYYCWNHVIRPALNRAGIQILREYELSRNQRNTICDFFYEKHSPLLTPLAIDRCHPRPAYINQCPYVGALLSRSKQLGPDRLFGVIQLPPELSRLVMVDGGKNSTFVFLEDVIAANLRQLFGGYEWSDWCVFRFTRDCRSSATKRYPNCALCDAESKLKARRKSAILRLEISSGASHELIGKLIEQHSDSSDKSDAKNECAVFSIPGPVDLRPLVELTAILHGRSSPKFKSNGTKRTNNSLRTDMFTKISAGDVLLHHPGESFAPVTEFLNQAAEDPQVLSISQTLYRIGDGNPLIAPLKRAAENGKQVSALVELNARFDEADNIRCARRMEKHGIHVIYGIKDLKTHCKLALIVRQEERGIKRYVHLATGNYHHTTVPYADFGLLTANEDFGVDATNVFNMLSGYTQPENWQKLFVAPFNLHSKTIDLINDQASRARKGESSRIFAKINALSDRNVIEALIAASQAGVPIELIVSGVCTLRPGVSDISENIRVRNIVDEVYDHSRLFVFGPDEMSRVFLSSADWMRRNFDRRIEIMFPVEDPSLKYRILNEIVPGYLNTTAKSRFLTPDGAYILGTGKKAT